jgi:hypothetical protein
MAHYTGTVETPRPVEATFDYMADFTHVPEWDPNCEEAYKLTDGAIGVGTEFRLVFKAAGQDLDLRYRVTEYEAPRRIRLEGGNDTIQSVDTVDVTASGGRTQVEYTVDITFTGLKKVMNPALSLGISKAGSDAREGLEKRLN